jgi:hypothetical protein
VSDGPEQPEPPSGAEPAGERNGKHDVVPEEADAQAEARSAAARRRRLDEVFGSGEHHGGGKDDAWYRDQVPPHHG